VRHVVEEEGNDIYLASSSSSFSSTTCRTYHATRTWQLLNLTSDTRQL